MEFRLCGEFLNIRVESVCIGNGYDNKREVGGISLTQADQPDFAGGEPLDVPEAMELLSRMKHQNGQRT